MVILAFRKVELHEDAPHVFLDRALGDPEAMADPGVGASLRHQGEHLTLACGEYGERVVHPTGTDEFRHEGRVDDRVSARDPLDRLDEFGHGGGPALAEVADL